MKEVISQVNLQTQIGKLALAIKKYESRTDTPIVFVGILNGAFMFFSDLVKKVDIPIEVDEDEETIKIVQLVKSHDPTVS